MTLAHGADRLESARLVLRRITMDDLPFFTRLHALPEVAQHLYPGGRPRSAEQTAAFLRSILDSYERLALGYLAVLRKEDGALIGRCGIMELAVETAIPEHGLRKGWFGPPEAVAGVAVTYECELGYTFDPAEWGQGFATEAAGCVRDYARDVLRWPYRRGHSSPERPLAARRRTVGRTLCRPNGSSGCSVGSLRVFACHKWRNSAPASVDEIGDPCTRPQATEPGASQGISIMAAG
jgi:[ribosomal protein S5]-alanine N-acetyltransferase